MRRPPIRTRSAYLLVALLSSAAACSDPSDPQIEALLPERGSPGSIVEIVGERFDGRERSVAFGGTSAEVLLWQPQRARARVPGGLSGLTLVVVTIDGRPSNAATFNVGATDGGP